MVNIAMLAMLVGWPTYAQTAGSVDGSSTSDSSKYTVKSSDDEGDITPVTPLTLGTTSSDSDITLTNSLTNAGMGGSTTAPICPESDAGTALGCDMSYRNTKVSCLDTYQTKDKDGTTVNLPSLLFKSCPTKPMPMRDTPRLSFIKDFSPFLYDWIIDPDDPTHSYAGYAVRGTTGDMMQAFATIGTTPKGVTRQKGCVNQIDMSGATSLADRAKLIRLQLDDCANQFILNTAIWPEYKAYSDFICGTASNPTKRCSQEDMCQPLRMVKDDKQEYLPSTYIKAAWEKLLNNGKLLRDGKAPKEPQLPSGLTLQNPIAVPSINEIRINQLAETPYEEIIDPSHPFTPRWDYENNERDKYSPLTQAYGGDTKNGVYCAGSKDKVYKVDILTFRDKALKFDDHVTERINYNSSCHNNTGLQKNPCCVLDIIGTILGGGKPKCKFLSCETCYAMKADKPVCSTTYDQSPDRRHIIATHDGMPVFPVALELRAAQTVAQLKNALALSSLPAGATVSQVASVVKANAGMIGSLANTFGANLPMSQIMPLMNGQLNMMSALKTLNINVNGINIAGMNLNLNINNLGSLLSAPNQFLSSFGSNMNFDSVKGFLNNQAGMMLGLPSGTSLTQAFSSMDSIKSTLSQVSGLGGDIASAKSLMSKGVAMSKAMPSGFTVKQAEGLYNDYLAQMANLPSTTTVESAYSLVKGKLDDGGKLFDSMTKETTVGEASTVIKSQIAGLGTFDSSAAVSSFTNILDNQVSSMMGLPNSMNVSDAVHMVGSLRDTFSNMGSSGSGGIDLSKIDAKATGAFLENQIDSMVQLPAGLKVSQVTSMLTSQQSLMSGITNLTSLNNIQAVFTAQLKNLGPLGNISASVVGNIMNGQLGSLSSLAGSLNISSVAGAIDTQFFGGTGIASSVASNLSNLKSLPTSLSSVPGLSASSASDFMKGFSNFDIGSCLVGGGKTIDLHCVMAFLPLAKTTAPCNTDEITDNTPPMAELCRKLRAPLTPINKLKMRYHNPGDTSSQVLKEGVQEGLSFNDYFYDDQTKVGHMPYMRLWDTGRSIQLSKATDQDPMDTSGQYTSIVGVGRAAAPDSLNNLLPDDEKHNDERCLYGGWGSSSVDVAGIHINVPDPITSWTELKLYQANTTRETNVVCLGRYEKAFQHRSNEAQLLGGSGAIRTGIIESIDSTDANGNHSQTSADIGDNGGQRSSDSSRLQYKNMGIPLAWRGYFTAKDQSKRFPNLGSSHSLITGLDNAQCGDIILMPNGGGTTSGTDDQGNPTRGLPKLARVTCTESAKPGQSAVVGDSGHQHIVVVEADNGRWPDACGTTNMLGDMKSRNLYKPDNMDKDLKSTLTKLGWTYHCYDTMLQDCEMDNWSTLQLYRPADDVREGQQ